MSVGKRIKEARLRSGMSQQEVADAIKSTKQAVYKYENEIVTNIPIDKIEKMADLFDVTPAYLMGWQTKSEKTESEITSSVLPLSDHEESIIKAYRLRADLQIAVDRLLGVEDGDTVMIYSAAHSVDNRPDGIIRMSKKDWERLKNTPESPDTLI